ncbi:hypothetical protein GCM10010129_48440 [Streptomyces fumigatiscleroticus]|nr:hypothetical protein GCM10010129_48440 [Streptomyces fumigatiscleroticus]
MADGILWTTDGAVDEGSGASGGRGAVRGRRGGPGAVHRGVPEGAERAGAGRPRRPAGATAVTDAAAGPGAGRPPVPAGRAAGPAAQRRSSKASAKSRPGIPDTGGAVIRAAKSSRR